MKDKYYYGHIDFDDIKKMNKEEKYNLAKLLSEDNKYLEKLLLKCWKNNIKTFACCKGHNKDNLAYIGFEINDNSIDYINMLLNNLENTDYNIISLSSTNNNVFDNPSINRYAFDIQTHYKNADNLFKTLNSYLSIRNKEENINDLLKHSILINQIFTNTEISTCIMKTNNKLYIDITKPKSNNSPHYSGNLETNINSIKNNKKILCNRFDCNCDSLTSFIKCFYINYNPNKIKIH